MNNTNAEKTSAQIESENFALVPFEFSYHESMWSDFVNVLALHYARLVAKMADLKYRENTYLDGHRSAFLDAIDLAYYVADEDEQDNFRLFAKGLATMKERSAYYDQSGSAQPGSFEAGYDRAVADMTKIVNAVISGQVMDNEFFAEIEKYLVAPE